VTRRPAVLGILLACAALADSADTAPPRGLRDHTPQVHALVGARLVVSPGRVVESGVLILRDGVIEAAGAGVTVPPDAEVRDLKGRTVYPGFIDAYASWPPEAGKKAGGEGKGGKKRRKKEPKEEKPAEAPPGGARHWNPNVTPDLRVDARYAPDEEADRPWRSQGVTARLLAPPRGVLRGTSVLVGTGEGDVGRLVLTPQVAMHASLDPDPQRSEGYPSSAMGAIALLRQACCDADWYGRAWEAYARGKGVPRPEANAPLEALQRWLAGRLPVLFDCSDELGVLRAQRIAQEFALNAIVRGSGREYRRLDAVKAAGLPLVLPLVFPGAPDVRTPEAALGVSLKELMHWDLAPENPGRLDRSGVRIAFTGEGLDRPEDFLPALRKAVARGLDKEAALKALTVTPAALFGVSDRLGTLEPGKAAHLVVADGDLFDPKGKARVLETWVDGRRYEADPWQGGDPRGVWELASADPAVAASLVLEGEPGKLSGRVERDGLVTPLRQVAVDAGRLAFLVDGKALGLEGAVRMGAPLAGEVLDGEGVRADGHRFSWRAVRKGPPIEEKDEKEGKADAPPREAMYPVNFPLGAFGLEAPPPQPEALLFRNATVWTCGPQGILEGASVLVKAGRIVAVGRDLDVPPGALIVDATGKHLTPGVIDCHSHIAIAGNVNEAGQAVTAEVRIGDVLDGDGIAIYRELAGGVTTANLLHGSANPIGGQNQVIKLRWGALPEALKFAGAPAGIKFALGENPKQSNWDRHDRYPQTRMGVEEIIRDTFQAARDYRKSWRVAPSGLPPRRDLTLEAVGEILDGKRLIHCHAYRQDEMLALMRLCEDFGVRIGTFQHVLEGYKIAEAMHRHGVGGSSFSDWWAYKIEVYDAIPTNGALLQEAGVLVSFNSDSPELARRLNTEAAKAVKYGGVSPEEALKFVTSNPARQLGILGSVGTLEPGKDADLALWSGPPLSTFSVCEQTWIDGRRMFDRTEDLARRSGLEAMREALIQRVLASEGSDGKKKGGKPEPEREVQCCHDDDE
jgi:imidazolonepropionase-like amidohydrolase